MRMFLEDDVLEHAKKRFRFLHNEFDHMVVSVSGGKDSQVVFELAYRTAKEMGQLPIYCLWLDQEAEYQATEDIIKQWMQRDGVEPIWMQCEFLMGNGAGFEQEFLVAWDQELDDEDYMRPRTDWAIHGDAEEKYGADRFYELFTPVAYQETPDEGTVASVSGVRAEESPSRAAGLTGQNTYKGITYGSETSIEDMFSFFPIYDWTWSDVWKFIHDNELEYNEIYDKQFQHGVPVRNMRISHLHHEQSIQNLFRLQQFEPDTFNALVERVDGIHSTAELGEEGLNGANGELPFMFEDWREYRNYLLAKLITEEEDRATMKRNFFKIDLMREHVPNYRSTLGGHVIGIMQNDNEADGILKDMRQSNTNDHTRAVRDAKMKWLMEEKPEVWEELAEKGIVNRSYEETRLEDIDPDVTVREPDDPDRARQYAIQCASDGEPTMDYEMYTGTL